MKLFKLLQLTTVFLATSLVCFELTAQTPQTPEPKQWVEYPAAKGPGEGKRIVFISGDEEYRSEESMPMLAQILSQRHGFNCTVLFAVNPKTGFIEPGHQTNIPGMQRIDGADLVVLGLRFRQLPDEQMKHFVDYVDSGKPIIGFRTSTHAFNYPNDSSSPYRNYGWKNSEWKGGFGRQVLGDTWVSHHGHHGQEGTRAVIVESQKDNPILNGVKDVWGTTDVYTVIHLPETATVLLRGLVLQGMEPDSPPAVGGKNEPMMPLAWTNSYLSKSGKTSKIFCTTMGAATDFASEDLRRLLVNACYWAVGLEDSIPKKADVDYVSDYNPTKFGFGGEKKGVKPSDHVLSNKQIDK